MVWPLAERGDRGREARVQIAARHAGLLAPALALAMFAWIGRSAAEDLAGVSSVVSVGQDLVVSIVNPGHLTTEGVRSGIVLNLEALSETAAALQGGASSQILTELDCRHRQARTLSFRVFSAPRQTGEAMNRPTQFVWSPILGGTYLFEVADRLCQKLDSPLPGPPTPVSGLVLRPEKRAPSADPEQTHPQAPRTFVQLYASDNAEQTATHYDQVIARKLRLPQGASIYVEDATVGGRILHRLRAGPFTTREQALGFCQGLRHAAGLEAIPAQACIVTPASPPRS